MIKGFLDFIKQGNVVDLAVAVVLGTAFGAVIHALVENVLMPLVGQLFAQEPDFDALFAVTLPGFEGPPMRFGVLLTAVVNFLLIAAAIYVVVIVPMNRMIAARRARLGAAAEEPDAEDIALLKEIRDHLRVQAEAANPAAFSASADREHPTAAQPGPGRGGAAESTRLGRARSIFRGRS
ncbi:large conductance mechanosensitive channel protein MscL [Nesterenkonia sphaerica]|uniref:Large-conductance mechanosensitive channel n=1 Tax=Nesterenkonia sphaerica TaxID=1804988 RepID=A0A5R9AGL2_9MICC|nr:large conductance mechanosensitive channel protein MscL [Nesterenkonia sphaerica]